MHRLMLERTRGLLSHMLGGLPCSVTAGNTHTGPHCFVTDCRATGHGAPGNNALVCGAVRIICP